MNFAQLDSRNVVISLVVADQRPDGCVPNDGWAQVGLIYDLGTFRYPRWTAFEFLQRFTESELEIVRGRAVSDPIVWRFLTFAQAAQEIDAGDAMHTVPVDHLSPDELQTVQRTALLELTACSAQIASNQGSVSCCE
jgi:hypothetical protein